MGNLILVLGGARSGKSSFAEQLAKELGGDNVLFVATSEARDEEMRIRVEKHRAARPSSWQTLEAPTNIANAIRQANVVVKAIIIDCLTVLVSNHLLSITNPEKGSSSFDPFDRQVEDKILTEVVDQLINWVHETNATTIAVSNEVGMGIVPFYELGRAYRDILGRTNQILAQYANEVYLLVAGIPIKIK